MKVKRKKERKEGKKERRSIKGWPVPLSHSQEQKERKEIKRKRERRKKEGKRKSRHTLETSDLVKMNIKEYR